MKFPRDRNQLLLFRFPSAPPRSPHWTRRRSLPRQRPSRRGPGRTFDRYFFFFFSTPSVRQINGVRSVPARTTVPVCAGCRQIFLVRLVHVSKCQPTPSTECRSTSRPRRPDAEAGRARNATRPTPGNITLSVAPLTRLRSLPTTYRGYSFPSCFPVRDPSPVSSFSGGQLILIIIVFRLNSYTFTFGSRFYNFFRVSNFTSRKAPRPVGNP